MKTLIIYESVYHNNTEQIAKVIGEVLGAKLIKAKDADAELLAGYDLIGFGSGIYNTRHHESLFDLVASLPNQFGKAAFIFSTNTFGLTKLHEPLKKQLTAKGFRISGEFSCRGYFAMLGFIKLGKGRPGAKDFEKAKVFAKELSSGRFS